MSFARVDITIKPDVDVVELVRFLSSLKEWEGVIEGFDFVVD